MAAPDRCIRRLVGGSRPTRQRRRRGSPYRPRPARRGLSPLGFAGLTSAYRILDVPAHSHHLGAVILAEQLDPELPDRLAAVATQLGAAGTTAATFAVADDTVTSRRGDHTVRGRGTTGECDPRGYRPKTSPPQRRPPHSRQTRPVTVASSISRMPPATPDMTELGLKFLQPSTASPASRRPQRGRGRRPLCVDRTSQASGSHCRTCRSCAERWKGLSAKRCCRSAPGCSMGTAPDRTGSPTAPPPQPGVSR